MPKNPVYYDFHTPSPQKMQDIGCCNFARILFSMESTSSPAFNKTGAGQDENINFL
jgi:hypothetical protein